jgi:hypothetical protein
MAAEAPPAKFTALMAAEAPPAKFTRDGLVDPFEVSQQAIAHLSKGAQVDAIAKLAHGLAALTRELTERAARGQS